MVKNMKLSHAVAFYNRTKVITNTLKMFLVHNSREKNMKFKRNLQLFSRNQNKLINPNREKKEEWHKQTAKNEFQSQIVFSKLGAICDELIPQPLN